LKSKRFTDLAEKKIEKIEKEECHYQAAIARRRPMLTDKDYGMGEGVGRESELTPLHLMVIEKQSEMTRDRRGEPLPTDLKTFREMLFKLAAMDSQITINPIRVSDNSEYPDEQDCSYMPIFSAWSYLDRRRKQRRQVMIAEVLFSDRCYYLFEISKRPKRGERGEQFSTLALQHKDGLPLGLEMIMLMLRLCAKKEGH
jgi:hypothetical protein